MPTVIVLQLFRHVGFKTLLCCPAAHTIVRDKKPAAPEGNFVLSRSFGALGLLGVLATGVIWFGSGPPATRNLWNSSLYFEPNRGQVGEDIMFLASGPGYALQLKREELVFSAAREGGSIIRIRVLGGSRKVSISGGTPLAGKSHYYLGPDPAQWYTGLPHYASVSYHDVYPSVDLVLHGNEGRLEFDFVVRPGGDPNAIRLQFPDAAVTARADGDLSIKSGSEQVQIRKPQVYQETANGRRSIEGRFLRRGGTEVGFRVGPFDPARALVIDPVLVYSTFLSSRGTDGPSRIALDAAGNVYITGYSYSRETGQFTYVTKLSPSGSVLFTTRLLNGYYSNGIATDGAGNVYTTGSAGAGFTTTPGAFQRVIGGPTSTSNPQDAVVAKLSPDGRLIYATYLGGDGIEQGMGVAIDASGNALVVGFTTSTNFPVRNAIQPTYAGGACPAASFYYPCGDAFVAKLNATGSALVFSTYLGGSGDETGRAIAVDGVGNAYVTGQTPSTNFPVTAGAFQGSIRGRIDAYVSKFSPEGRLLYSTYLGGNWSQEAHDIAVDGGGRAHVVGQTTSPDFPVTPDAIQGAYAGGGDGFLVKLNSSGSALAYSTFLGGSRGENVTAIALDSSGNPHLLGWTTSSDFPEVDPFQDRPRIDSGGSSYAALFLSKLNASGSALLLSTYLGGMASFSSSNPLDIKVDAASNIYILGTASSADFPAVTPFVGPDSNFVAKFNPRTSLRVASVSPTSVPQLDDATLTVSGVGFRRESVVRRNGSDLQTTYVDDRTLQAFLPGTAVPNAGGFLVTVWTPGPDGGGSNPFPVAVVIPVPRLTLLDPSTVTAAGPRFTLSLYGSGFLLTSYVVFGGAEKQATFATRNLLQITVFADEIFSERTVPVVVYNDRPRFRSPGIFSNTIAFTVTGTGPFVNPGGAVNAASFSSQSLTAGSIVSLFGNRLASMPAVAESVPLPTTLGGVTVRFNTIPAPLLFASALQINLQVPWELAGQAQASLTVTADGLTGAAAFNLAGAAPGIFAINQGGSGQGAILIAGTGELAAPAGSIPERRARPVMRGEFISIYCTGLGPVNNRPATGSAASSSPLSRTATTPSVAIGGVPAPVSFSGLAPGFVGLYQIDVQVPQSTPTGNSVPVVINAGGTISNTVTVAIQ